MVVLDVTKQLSEVEMKHPGYQVWSILRMLSILKVLHNLLDIGVACICHKQVRLPILAMIAMVSW